MQEQRIQEGKCKLDRLIRNRSKGQAIYYVKENFNEKSLIIFIYGTISRCT